MLDLAFYLSTVLSVITPQTQTNRRESIAADVAAVALTEEPAFDDDADKHRTALLLTAIAKWETGGSWAKWIDDGSCNDAVWRIVHAATMHGGDCDGGRAWGLWQVHAPGDDPSVGRAYVADRRTGIRAALGIARASLHAGQGLCWYTGELSPSCPKGAARLRTAQHLATAFPLASAPATASDTAGCTWTTSGTLPLAVVLRGRALADVAQVGAEYAERVEGRVYRFRWGTRSAPVEVESCE